MNDEFKLGNIEDVIKERDCLKAENKVLFKEINKLKNDLKDLEEKDNFKLTPIECAAKLIEHGCSSNGSKYSVDELQQIAEHLIVYCNHISGTVCLFPKNERERKTPFSVLPQKNIF